MIDRPENVKIEWLSRVSADLLAPDRPELQEVLERIMREIYDQLLALMAGRRPT